MIRLQTVLVILVIVAVIIWGIRTVASDAVEATPDPSAIALQVTNTPPPTAEPTSTIPAPTNTPRPTREPTSEPTVEPTDEPTEEPETVERPNPPEVGEPGEAVLIERGESGRLEIALTFDAGEGPGYTAEILDMLADYGIKGTFGVTGEWAEQNPELIQRIVDEGHMIINHTYDHRSFTGVSPGTDPLTAEERQEEVTKTEAIIADISGYESAPYFRFPYGDYDAASLVELDEIGFHIIAGYTCDTMAWYGYTSDEIVENCNPESVDGGPGAVILMHVVQDADFAALPDLIDEYAAAGYDFVTFEQIIQP